MENFFKSVINDNTTQVNDIKLNGFNTPFNGFFNGFMKTESYESPCARCPNTQAQKPFYVCLTLLDDVIWIDLDGKLIIWPAETVFAQDSYNMFKNRKGQHRRGAAAYI